MTWPQALFLITLVVCVTFIAIAVIALEYGRSKTGKGS